MGMPLAFSQGHGHILLDGHRRFLGVLRQIDEAEPAQTQHLGNGVVIEHGAYGQCKIKFISELHFRYNVTFMAFLKGQLQTPVLRALRLTCYGSIFAYRYSI